jgi:hypothetical protein
VISLRAFFVGCRQDLFSAERRSPDLAGWSSRFSGFPSRLKLELQLGIAPGQETGAPMDKASSSVFAFCGDQFGLFCAGELR